MPEISHTHNEASTPMLKQYRRIKGEYPGAILLFRLGDFYEMFFEDAVLASGILGITLTARNKNDPNPVPLCGVPYHAADGYISKLLESGKRVAVCDQVEDPKFAKGIVKREVTRVLTPGVVACGLGLDAGRYNFLAAVATVGDKYGVAIADISTGLFQAGEFDSIETLTEELGRTDPKEVVVENGSNVSDIDTKLKKAFPNILITTIDSERIIPDKLFSLDGARQTADKNPAAFRAASIAHTYLSDTQMGKVGQIVSLSPFSFEKVMRIDEATIRNLELVRTLRDADREGSILSALDKTKTAAGARKLRRWLLYPLKDPPEIEERLSAVETFIKEPGFHKRTAELLQKIYDVERITARSVANAANARDMIALKNSLQAVTELKALLKDSTGLLSMLGDSIDVCIDILSEIGVKVVDDPPFSIKEGGIIKSGVSNELDELRGIISHGKDYIASLEAKEKEATGISSLKIRYNRVFGYYLEVTNSHLSKVPETYIRKQTLTNAERYITPELKEYEEKVVGAQEKVKAIEYDIFEAMRAKVADATSRLQRTADAVASIDVLCSFAHVAAEHDYTKPVVDDSEELSIKGGRHPIIERLNSFERFIPNDVVMNSSESRMLMITGPNMAGKSTVMRQTAIIVLMAQIGSYVPAASAHIGVVDRIFTRVGASDALSKGQSTFMVEMSETALILRDATPKSLIIIDEIGRGTSTFDGLSIAWAVAEYLHDHVKAKTMFATHYHELTDLALTKHDIKNMQIAVREWNGQVVFLRKLISGATSKSYGIQVAKLAGLPEFVITRAGEVLKNLEEIELDDVGEPRLSHAKPGNASVSNTSQYQLFTELPNEIMTKLGDVDTDAITPIEALNLLHEIKKKM